MRESRFGVPLVTLLCLFLPAKPAGAVMVFVDVNNSFDEIKTVRESLPQGETLVVLPTHDRKTGEQIRSLQKQEKKAWAEYSTLNCYGQILCKGKFTDSACDAAYDKADKLGDALTKMTEGKLSAESIADDLSKIYANGQKVSSIFFSGEDGGSLFGAYGTVEYADLRKAIAKVPQLQQDVQSLYLWGCYTGTSGKLNGTWKSMFPSAKYAVGFHDSGPADGSPPSMALIKKAIKSEQEAFDLNTKKTVRRFFDTMRETSQMHTSMFINNCYVDKKTVFSLTEMEEQGKKCFQNYPKALHEKFLCYQEGKEACPHPPADHQSGDLRTFYAYLRKNETCLTNPEFYRQVTDVPSPDSVLRLIYFDRIWENFLRVYGSDMQRLNSLLAASGHKPELQFKASANMSRQEFLKWHHDAMEAVAPNKDPKNKYIKKALDRVHTGMIELNSWYIPNGWITGPSTQKGSYDMNVEAKCDENP